MTIKNPQRNKRKTTNNQVKYQKCPNKIRKEIQIITRKIYNFVPQIIKKQHVMLQTLSKNIQIISITHSPFLYTYTHIYVVIIQVEQIARGI